MSNWKLFLWVVVFTLSTLRPYAQDKKSESCFYTRERALADIKNSKAKVLVQGGFAPIIYATDKGFFEKYKISYYIFGCVAPENVECLIDYNQAIFAHLDKTFGKGWRKDARKDAIGLRQ